MYKGDCSRKETLIEYGFRLSSAQDNRPLRFGEFEWLSGQIVFISATSGPYEREHCSGAIVEQVMRPDTTGGSQSRSAHGFVSGGQSVGGKSASGSKLRSGC